MGASIRVARTPILSANRVGAGFGEDDKRLEQYLGSFL